MTVNDCFLLHSPSDEGEAKRSTPADAQLNRSFNLPKDQNMSQGCSVASRIFWLITNEHANYIYVLCTELLSIESTETADL